jgi:hypothetical protein
MSDAIDPRVQFFMARMTDDACDDLTILDLAAELTRQLLPLDARKRIVEWFRESCLDVDANDDVYDDDDLSRFADQILAALSANGSDVATSPASPDHVAVSREDASEYLRTLEGEQMEMNPFAWVGSKQELQDRIDRIRAALSATSPEAAAECPEVACWRCYGSGKYSAQGFEGVQWCPTCRGTGKVAG